VTIRWPEPHSTTAVIANAALLAAAFRAAGAAVVLVHVATSPDGGGRLHSPVDEPQVRAQMPPDFAEIVPELGPGDNDIVVTKRQWGAFYGTDLDLQLERRGIVTVVLGGIATNYGVESTARDAYERGYHLVLVEDAMSARSTADHAFACERIFPRLGRLSHTAEVLAALTA